MTAARIYTSSGWQEIMFVGASGPQGPSSTPPSRVTALPGSPVNGQEIYYTPPSLSDFTRLDYPAVVWHLRYNAANTTIYKWEFIEGTVATKAALASKLLGSFASATWVDPDGIEGNIQSMPAGIYDVEVGGSYMMPAACTIAISAGTSQAATKPTLGTDTSEENAAANQYVNIVNRKRITLVTGGWEINSWVYQSGPVGTMGMRGRWWSATPVSLG